MKYVIVGDVHHSPIWEDVLEKEGSDSAYIFLGDYFDSFFFDRDGMTYDLAIDRFNRIVDLVRKNPKSALLFGNHEYHYIHPSLNYSGKSIAFAHDVYESIKGASDVLKLFHYIEEEHVLCSHAGFTEYWLNQNLDYDFKSDPQSIIWSHQKIKDLNWEGSPIWVRPNDLLGDSVLSKNSAVLGIERTEPITQIVGHTPVNLRHIKSKSEDALKGATQRSNVIFMDTSEQHVFNKYAMCYLVINDGTREWKWIER